MKKTLIIIAVIIGVALLWFIGTGNSLVSLKENVNMEYSQIETLLQRRLDLIPNLVSTVSGYADHETEVFTEIANARAKLAGSLESGEVESVAQASGELDSALGRLLAITESYPELKADKLFIGLQDELAGTENRIAVARQNYNEAVSAYNKSVQKFPGSIVAGMKGHYPLSYFEADDKAYEVPTVNFG